MSFSTIHFLSHINFLWNIQPSQIPKPTVLSNRKNTSLAVLEGKSHLSWASSNFFFTTRNTLAFLYLYLSMVRPSPCTFDANFSCFFRYGSPLYSWSHFLLPGSTIRDNTCISEIPLFPLFFSVCSLTINIFRGLLFSKLKKKKKPKWKNFLWFCFA